MALTPPKWCSHAVPTRKGWVDPHTGEVLKAQRISDVDLQNFRDKESGVKITKEEKEAIVTSIAPPTLLTEAPPAKSLEEMTKSELIALGEHHGLDLNSRDRKDTLIEKLEQEQLSE
jgi:hypothetical protein